MDKSGIKREGSDSIGALTWGRRAVSKPPCPRGLLIGYWMASEMNVSRRSLEGRSNGWRDGEMVEHYRAGPAGF